MKLSKSYFYTLRENPKDEESISGKLLVRSGMIRKVGAGIYMFMPLGLRVLDNIRKIIKEEMDLASAQEMLMPSLIPTDYYAASGRLDAFGQSVFRLKDRGDKPYALGPTHEELFTIAASSMVRSYKDLPFTLYQQADKFRDEPRPRYGLIRVREFIMKDAYSFDRDEEGLDVSYQKMKQAYNRIFERMGVQYKLVRADVGTMGGSLSEEYQAITDIGEDTIVLCDHCDFSSNLEVAEVVINKESEEEKKKLELVETKENETIEDVCAYLKIDVKKSLKALLMDADGEFIVFFIRGDRELNPTKVCKLLGIRELNFANDELIATSNAVSGTTGPIGLKAKIIIDNEVLTMKNFCCGANQKGYHYINANVEDFHYDMVADIVNIKEGDICPHCGGTIYFKKGIEVGNLFKLGTKYSKSLGLNYLDENNQERPVVMGCYGIGAGRILASIVEQNNDEDGMILPFSIAPYEVSIVVVDVKNENMMCYANKLHDELEQKGVSVLLDDRNERVGVKFKDMDLIGIPLRITIGKHLEDGKVEYRLRKEKEVTLVSCDLLIDKILKEIKESK